MITNRNAAIYFAFMTLLSTMLGCKKQEMPNPSGDLIGIQNILHSTTGESLLATLVENEESRTTQSRAILYIMKNAADSIVIHNKYPEYGLRLNEINQYQIIDENEKEFKFTTRIAFGARTKTGLSGKIRILRDGKKIFTNQPERTFANQPKLIFTIEGTFKVLSPSAVLDIRVNSNSNMIIENRNPGYGLNKSWWNGNIDYSITDEDGRKFNFTSATAFPAKVVTDLSGGKLKIIMNDKIIFDNLPVLAPIFTIQEKKSGLVLYRGDYRPLLMVTLDIKKNSNGNIVIDNTNTTNTLTLWGPISQYLIKDEHGKEFDFFGKIQFSNRTQTGLSGKIRVSKNGRVLFSQF